MFTSRAEAVPKAGLAALPAEIYALKLQQKDHPFVGEAALVHQETAFRGFERAA
jgi:hypothetical protein